MRLLEQAALALEKGDRPVSVVLNRLDLDLATAHGARVYGATLRESVCLFMGIAEWRRVIISSDVKKRYACAARVSQPRGNGRAGRVCGWWVVHWWSCEDQMRGQQRRRELDCARGDGRVFLQLFLFLQPSAYSTAHQARECAGDLSRRSFYRYLNRSLV